MVHYVGCTLGNKWRKGISRGMSPRTRSSKERGLTPWDTGKDFGLGSGTIEMVRAHLKLFLPCLPFWESLGWSLEPRGTDPWFLRHCGSVSSRGKRHIMQQMQKKQEERSLFAEQQEQEKEQMLEYMEQLQEEDLRVIGLGRCARFYQHQQQSPPRFGDPRHMFISQHQHHHQLFIATLTIYLAMAACWGWAKIRIETVPASQEPGVQEWHVHASGLIK